ncbi:hypothetical protein EI42_02847 [Thermosporothrix hazakensis]|jgi:hypothetical protein|uniref:Uncharacterized protein n=1 Tax=Thermosporothrix hazakensis TaxID=644383 RepID=A0A326U6G8_THEHA|nr:hypothetical protein [Thermosporothrix hazakensis]PZW29551.1 hypothetical protein EI42_02847 [Thermosporothrix hazakensis]GCE45735.1 hypothetical protein KTH_06040 [Thermosporothrix hazakensis]
MNLALRNRQLLALVLLALVTVLVLTFVLLSAVAHVDVWHGLVSWSGTVFKPDIMYPHP